MIGQIRPVERKDCNDSYNVNPMVAKRNSQHAKGTSKEYSLRLIKAWVNSVLNGVFPSLEKSSGTFMISCHAVVKRSVLPSRSFPDRRSRDPLQSTGHIGHAGCCGGMVLFKPSSDLAMHRGGLQVFPDRLFVLAD